MVFHTSFGDIDEARAFAHRLASAANSVPDPIVRGLVLRRVGFALRQVGHPHDAVRLCRTALSLAEELEIPEHCVPALETLVDLSLDDGDFDQARQWLHRLRSIDSAYRPYYTSGAIFCLETRLAFETKDLGAVTVDASGGFKSIPLTSLRRSQQTLLTSLTAFELLKGRVGEAARMLATLRELHASLRSAGLQDFPVAVLCELLQQVGCTEESSTLLRHYLQGSRRGTQALPVSLLRSATALGVDMSKQFQPDSGPRLKNDLQLSVWDRTRRNVRRRNIS
jgi:hypothetical protein